MHVIIYFHWDAIQSIKTFTKTQNLIPKSSCIQTSQENTGKNNQKDLAILLAFHII